MMFKMNMVVTSDESTFQVRAIPTSDADAIRADVLVYNNRTKDAQALIDSTLRDDPKNAIAHETMGYLKFREGDIQAARKWYGEAVQLDSQSYLAHYYYATISMGSASTGQNDEIESSLRTCIKLNPDFAPAYDALAMHYSSIPEKADQAHILSVHAIDIDPGNLNYRLNAAAGLANGQHYEDALKVLKSAVLIAKTPEQVASVQDRIQQIEQFQEAMARSRQEQSEIAAQTISTTVTDTRVFTVTSSDGRKFDIKPDTTQNGPKYPTEALTGPHHTARGVLRSVQCSYPSILTLQVEQPGKTAPVSLYRNDFYQIDFTVTNFTPKSNINPCTDIQGLKAKVEYAEVSDKSIAGQIISIELSK